MNNLIIFAGYPATGKTYVINKIIEKHNDFVYLPIDKIEECLYENFGFDNPYEKKELYNLSFKLFYLMLEKHMKKNEDIIIDYPFSYLQYGPLKELSTKYNYNNITIRLTGDLEVIYSRRVKRDLDPSRNAGHLLDKYNSDMKIDKKLRERYLITYEDFVNHCKLREYDDFQLGALLVEDVTKNFADISRILEFLKTEMRAKNNDN